MDEAKAEEVKEEEAEELRHIRTLSLIFYLFVREPSTLLPPQPGKKINTGQNVNLRHWQMNDDDDDDYDEEEEDKKEAEKQHQNFLKVYNYNLIVDCTILEQIALITLPLRTANYARHRQSI